MEKKPWTKPVLLVIVRRHPEEAVLSTCKDGTISGSSAAFDGTCFSLFSFGCTTCHSQAGS